MPSFAASLLLPLLAIPPVLAGASVHTQPKGRHGRHGDLAKSLLRSSASTGGLSRRATLPPIDGSPVLGGYKTVGDSGVSAQMMFLGTTNTVYMLDSGCPRGKRTMSSRRRFFFAPCLGKSAKLTDRLL